MRTLSFSVDKSEHTAHARLNRDDDLYLFFKTMTFLIEEEDCEDAFSFFKTRGHFKVVRSQIQLFVSKTTMYETDMTLGWDFPTSTLPETRWNCSINTTEDLSFLIPSKPKDIAFGIWNLQSNKITKLN